MPSTETYIAHLLLKQFGGQLTAEEEQELNEWRSLTAGNARFLEEVQEPAAFMARLQDFEKAAAQAALVQVPAIPVSAPPVTVHRVHFLRRGWLRYAAMLLLVLGAGTLYWTMQRKQEAELAKAKMVQPEIVPAGLKATLTLSDGSTITLDSSTHGTIAQQGNMAVVQNAHGEIRYEAKGAAKSTIMTNTMRTPKGGQYRLTLPDGTKVWLNAASSITYPAAFVNNTRQVKVSGEVYLEVAHDTAKPFLVDVDGYGTVEALGTSFNINAYKDYGAIKTTLVEGKVRVTSSIKAVGAIELIPGQQAVQEAGAAVNDKAATHALRIAKTVDLQQVLAWKNGIFNFTGADFETLMKEVERWYDVEVKYEGAIPDIKFKGKMDRAVKLSGVLRFLNEYGIMIQQDGRILLVKDNKKPVTK